ncbi:MAG: hypothetical protein AAGG68_08060 [Bacteroidota bacterium]
MRYIFFAIIVLLFAACSSSTLDKPFQAEYHDAYYQKLFQEKEITPNELFLTNYSVVRQRDYYDYEIEGKTYREILEQAKQFSEQGLPIKTEYATFNKVENLSITTENDGSSTMRPDAGSSRLVKVFRFNANYENTGEKDIALLSSTFLIKGPFQEHIATVGYEINCLLEAGAKVPMGFLVEARAIRDNVLYAKNYETKQVDIETLIYNLTVESAGQEVTYNTAYFDDCIKSEARRAPFKIIDYEEDMNEEDWIVMDDTGNVISLKIQPTFLKAEYSDEVIDINDLRN